MGNGAGDVKVEVLRGMYDTNSLAKYIFDYFAVRGRRASETKTDRLLQILYQQGESASRSQVIEYFRTLENAGCGRYVEGRKGHPSRFEWFVDFRDASKAAAGGEGTVEEIQLVTADPDDLEESLLPHEYRLRPALVIRFDLPNDLTPAEASRLADYIKTLPFS